MNILASRSFIKCGFEISLELKQYDNLSEFDHKWKRDPDGLVKSDYGCFNCSYYTIGKLKDGFDCTVASAQKDFNRDCHAFDVHLFITVSKNGIELIDDPIVGSDYNFDDDLTPEQLLEYLYNYHGDLAENQIKEAKEILKSLCED